MAKESNSVLFTYFLSDCCGKLRSVLLKLMLLNVLRMQVGAFFTYAVAVAVMWLV